VVHILAWWHQKKNPRRTLVTKKPDKRTESESMPATDQIEERSHDGLLGSRGKIAGGLFILAAIFVILCPLLTGSCSDSANNHAPPPPVTPEEAVPPSVPSAADVPEIDTPAEPPIQEVQVEDYIGNMVVANIGIIGFSPDELDIAGDVINGGDLIIDEVEISIRYLNVAGKTVFTDQHKLIGELPSPKALRPGRAQPFDYKIDSEHYAEAPDLRIEITNLQIRPPVD
jgi:hypothetical protein